MYLWRCLHFYGSIIYFPMRFVTGASFHTPRQRNSTYVQTVRWYIYETRRPAHPHLPIRLYKECSQGPPIHGPVTCNPAVHVPTLCYGYAYAYAYGPVRLRRLHESPQALHRCVNSLPIIVSGIQR